MTTYKVYFSIPSTRLRESVVTMGYVEAENLLVAASKVSTYCLYHGYTLLCVVDFDFKDFSNVEHFL